MKIQYIRGGRNGLSVNRNTGLDNCSGDIIAFPDDDCEYPEDTLERAASFFEKNPAFGFFSCNVREKTGGETILAGKRFDTEITLRNFMETSISFTVFIRAERMASFRFDEQLGLGAEYGSAEESDLLLFLLKNNTRGFYCAKACIYHPNSPRSADRLFSYGKGFGALHKKAVVAYRFYRFLPRFLLVLLKETVKLCFVSPRKERLATVKGRLYGFIHYKKIKKILINGDFYCRKITGVERYAHEITLRLDGLCRPGEIALIVPRNARNTPEFKNISVIRHPRGAGSFFFWQMVTLQWFLVRRREYLVLEFGNTCLPLAPGIVCLHDIYYELFPGDFTTLREKCEKWYYRFMYRVAAKYAKKIITVSNYSREQIVKIFKVNPGKIAVVYSSWDHFKKIKADYSVFTAFPALEKPFFFSLGSLSKRKNIRWIAEYAAKHPEYLFALSGASFPTVKPEELRTAEIPSNILALGYLGDSQVKALMERCRAFILPSYYEGFGLTPLEALSCGAPVIVSGAASLPEIYGNTARYIDPYNTDVDLDLLLREPAEKPDALLRKYSYDASAAGLYRILRETAAG